MSRSIALKGLLRRASPVNPTREHVFHPSHRCCSSSGSMQSKMLEVRKSRGKGLGLFATENIPAHSRIIADTALISLREGEDLPEAYQQFIKLSDEAKADFFTFHRLEKPGDLALASKLADRGIPGLQIDEMVKVSSIFTANAFRVPDDSIDQTSLKHGMFPIVSRINHSCQPNAHSNFNANSEKMMVHTLFDIELGTEVYISYFNLLLPLKQRQAKASQWGFECSCPVCQIESNKEEDIQTSRRARIRQIETDLLNLITAPNESEQIKRSAVDLANEMVDQVLDDKYLTPLLPIAFDHLATAQLMVLEKAPDFSLLSSIHQNLSRAVDIECSITGNDSHSTAKRKEKLELFASAVGLGERTVQK